MAPFGNTARIAFILKGYPRLSETFILNEILLLEALGFQLHIVAMRNPGESKTHTAVERVNAAVTYIPDYFWPHAFAFLSSLIRCFVRKPRVVWAAFRFAAWQSVRHLEAQTIKRFMQAVYWVERCYPQTEIHYLHAHFSNDPTTLAFFASWLTGLPYSFSAHAKDMYVQDRTLLKLKIVRARFVVTCTGFNKTFLEQLAPPAVPIYCCYHGINLEFYTPRKKVTPNPIPQILSIGRLVPKKGFLTLIRALQRVRQSGIAFHCTIIGSGPQKAAMLQLIAELDLQDQVNVRPEMSQQELFEYYQSADLFALACEVQSDGDRDGIPNVIVEAMAMGVPVVSTRISGIPECVEDGVTGILVPEKNVEALAAAIETILGNPDLGAHYGEAARQKIAASFDAKKNVHKIARALHAAMLPGNGKVSTNPIPLQSNGHISAARAIDTDRN